MKIELGQIWRNKINGHLLEVVESLDPPRYNVPYVAVKGPNGVSYTTEVNFYRYCEFVSSSKEPNK